MSTLSEIRDYLLPALVPTIMAILFFNNIPMHLVFLLIDISAMLLFSKYYIMLKKRLGERIMSSILQILIVLSVSSMQIYIIKSLVNIYRLFNS